MSTETRTTDAKGRVSLPKAFASSTITIEVVSDTELRIRKVRVVPKEEMVFAEESRLRLSKRDQERLLDLLMNPPKPNAALKRAAATPRAGRP